MELDLVREQILSIEDFDNIDPGLMEKINGNAEYRRLFEECRELSLLIAESAPAPVKDGVTLHDAVMNRVKDGDIAPRYINTSKFRFPFATVASLVVVVATVLIVKNGNIIKKDAAVEQIADMEMAEGDPKEESRAFYSDTSFGIMNSKAEETDDMAAPETTSYKGVAYEKGVDPNGTASENNSVMYTAGVGGTSSAPAQNSSAELRVETVAEEYDAEILMDDSMKDSMADSIEESAEESAKGGENASLKIGSAGGASVTEQKPAQTAPKADSDYDGNAVTTDSAVPETESDITGAKTEGTQAVSEPEMDSEILSKMIYASKYVPKNMLMTYETIVGLGKDNYIAWFGEIESSVEFSELYNYENFAEYCRRNAAE